MPRGISPIVSTNVLNFVVGLYLDSSLLNPSNAQKEKSKFCLESTPA